MGRKAGKARNVKLSDLKVNEEFAPKPDPVFNHLIAEAAKGRLAAAFHAYVDGEELLNDINPEVRAPAEEILAWLTSNERSKPAKKPQRKRHK